MVSEARRTRAARRRSLVMAMVGLVVIAAASSVALAKGPPVVAPASRRFDHDRHAASAGAAGKPVACAACHADKPRAEHERCVGCHAFPSSCSVMQTPGVAGPARVCRTCHTATRPECLPRDLPPLPATSSFVPRFAHARHLAVGPSIERDCGVCHRAQAEPPRQKPHVLCSGCHNANGARPAMTECASCHASGAAKPAPASPAGDPFRLPAFDHRAHTTASKLTACLSCHDKPVDDLPKPSMLGCQTRCHDGQKAFSATGTHCTTCHKASAPVPALKNDLGFSHTEHAKRNVKITECSTCHALDNDGTLAAPLSRKDHLPCASAGCHQSEYAARAPKICGVCHDAASPWARAVARPGKRRGVEWFEAMNHASHLGPGKTATCETCHGDKRTGGEAPRDHRACATCHARGQAPVMTDCKACHGSTRASKLAASEWNVAATFEHARHATDPRSHRATACTECHTQVAAARDMAQVTAPRMADCDGCHDGKTAFKTTGFGCVRCHGPKPVTASLP
jgi:c(7)-type cytochrome triheme protein